MKVQIIAIGDELLIGQVKDTNSSYLARTLLKEGWELEKISVIGDTPGVIKETVERALKECDVIITSGGLGPTRDDMTKATLASIFGGEMIRVPDVTDNIKKLFEKRGRALNDLTLDQAIVPSSCEVIQNDYGTAPIMVFSKGEKTLVSLPGVPIEFTHAWTDKVFPFLLKKYENKFSIRREVLIVHGITESDLAIRLSDFEENLPDFLHLAYLPKRPIIRLRLDGKHSDSEHLESTMNLQIEKLKSTIGQYLLAEGDKGLVEILFEKLKEHNYTVSTAESCTGGSIAGAITAVAGSSNFFKGGIVAYSNDIKEKILGVEHDVLAANGAVSIPVVKEMVNGAIRITGSDCSIATSGIAGPGGGSIEKPVGTVCIAVKTPGKLFSHTYRFEGSRENIIHASVETALLTLIELLGRD